MGATLHHAEAETLVRKTTTQTKNAAFFLLVNAPNGSQHEVVVKPRVAPDAHLHEWVAAALAQELGVQTPTSFAVSVSPQFISSLTPLYQPPFKSGVLLHGSEKFTGYNAPTRPLSADLKAAATNLLAFDAFVQNADRRDGNPNFVVGRSSLMAFDHEECFSHRLLIRKDDDGPASEDGVRDIILRHWCAPELARANFIDFRGRVRGLTDDAIDAIFRQVPKEWRSKAVDDISGYVKERRDRVDVWFPKVEACIP